MSEKIERKLIFAVNCVITTAVKSRLLALEVSATRNRIIASSSVVL